jgi:hypothetical protein
MQWSLLTWPETQVQPFNLTTPDNETIYGWHLLPLHLCREHEEELNANEPSGPAEDYTRTPAFKFLANDPDARVVVNCKYIDIFTSRLNQRLQYANESLINRSPWQCRAYRLRSETRNLSYVSGLVNALQPGPCLCN